MDGELYAVSAETDSFGHSQLGVLHKNRIAYFNRFKKSLVYSRLFAKGARHISSLTDIEQAVAVGKAAVKLQLKANLVLCLLLKINNNPYKWEISEGNLMTLPMKKKHCQETLFRNVARITREAAYTFNL